jgi:tetratricopeptide (TPR) repeat protein
MAGSNYALSCCNELLSRNPDDLDILKRKGEILINLSNFEGASEAFSAAKSAEGNRQNDPNKAIEKGLEASVDKYFADTWYNKGLNLSKQNKYDEAILAFDNATKLNPNHTEAWFGKAEAFESVYPPRFEEAIKYYDRVIQLDPDYYQAWQNLGWIFKELGRNDDANAAFEKNRAIRKRLESQTGMPYR